MDLSNFKLEHWWALLAVAGGLVLTASAPVHYVPTILIGLGLLACGIGEWINHPRRTQIVPGWKITGYPRDPSAGGTILTVFGVLLVVGGLATLFL